MQFSLYSLILTSYALVLYRRTGESDLVIAAQHHGTRGVLLALEIALLHLGYITSRVAVHLHLQSKHPVPACVLVCA